MSFALKLLIAVLLDVVLGDPYSFPHPVRWLGNLISLEERWIRHIPETKMRYRLLGFFATLFNLSLSVLFPLLVLRLLNERIYLRDLIENYFLYSAIAAGCLHCEALKVKRALSQSLELGRKQVSYIVGRDTANMSENEVIVATVETIAENTSDGVIAPLFYMFLLGPAGGYFYKCVNTMDSMWGYQNVKYCNLGFFPARLDDVFNWIPARLTAFLMLLSSFGSRYFCNAWRVFRRDRKKHASPNSGYPESVVAGLLGIQLGGRRSYGGEIVDKGFIGNPLRNIDSSHILESVKIMYRTEFLCLLIYFILWFEVFHG